MVSVTDGGFDMKDAPEQPVGHTAGPWVSETYVDEYGLSVIASDDAAYISNPSRGQVCHISVVAGASGNDPGRAKANARLIAAAPCLLEAAKAVEAIMAKNVYPQPDKPDSAWAALVALRAAISKALPMVSE